jgi:hypothetical protein
VEGRFGLAVNSLFGLANNRSSRGVHAKARRDVEAAASQRDRRRLPSAEGNVELASLLLAFEWIAAAHTAYQLMDELLEEAGWRKIDTGDLGELFLEYSALGMMLRADSVLWSQLPDKDPLSEGFLKARSQSGSHFTANQYTGEVGDNFYISPSGKNTARLWGCLQSNAMSFRMSLQAQLDGTSSGQILDFCRADGLARQFTDEPWGSNRWRRFGLGDGSWSFDAHRSYGGRDTFDLWFAAMKFEESRRLKWQMPEIFISISRSDSHP